MKGQRHREIESHLHTVRQAMEKEIRASLQNNRKAARQLAATKSYSPERNGGEKKTKRRSPKKQKLHLQQQQEQPVPLHEEKYMGGILEREQQKVMTKVENLIMKEFKMHNHASLASLDPTVLQPMLRSALIKYSRQGDLDAVRDLLEVSF